MTCDHCIGINTTLNAIYSEIGHYKVYSAVFLDKSTEDLRDRKEEELGEHYAVKWCVVCKFCRKNIYS